MQTFAEKVIHFNKTIEFTGELPEGIRIMNPFREDKKVNQVAALFYHKYYNDHLTRHIILGINPGRFGGGITGIPFTDPKRLTEKCGIPFHGDMKHEPSSAFIYEMIDAFGGPEKFYQKIYINSICPLGFTLTNDKGKEVNYNYYDSKELTAAVYDFITDSIQKQINFGVDTDTAFCFGTGKNEKFLRELNEEKKYFAKIIALEHPRFIMQYKAKKKQFYIGKYINNLNITPIPSLG
ncbi:MAG: uracil-DNA glycosylase family protein [Bacteroidota bacterium]